MSVKTSSKDDNYDVADSTDWLETSFAVLAPLEAALRCQVCKDFYTTPMITSCSHTFCSLCIRRCLSNDGRCPTCRTLEQELKLRSNLDMEEAVDAFQKARPIVLGHAKKISAPSFLSSPKRKAAEAEVGEEDSEVTRKRTRTSSRLASKQPESREVIPLEGQGADDAADNDYMPEDDVPSGQMIVSCPICSRQMKMDKINSHIDTCTGDSGDNYNSPARSGPGRKALKQTLPAPVRRFERLPQLSYSLLKEPALRKKLAELGLSTAGNRQLLEKRHTEWVTIWNANCDAKLPRKKGDLLQNLEIWERTQGSRATSTANGLNPGSQILSKDFDGAGWAAKHDQSFQQLIQQARSKIKQNTESQDPKNLVPETTPTNNHEILVGHSDESSIQIQGAPLVGVAAGMVEANGVSNVQNDDAMRTDGIPSGNSESLVDLSASAVYPPGYDNHENNHSN